MKMWSLLSVIALFLGSGYFASITYAESASRSFEDSQRVGEISDLIRKKEKKLQLAKQQVQQILEKERLKVARTMSYAYTLQRITHLQRRYGEDVAPHKKAYLTLMLKSLLLRNIHAMQQQEAILDTIERDQEHLQEIAYTFQQRTQAWINSFGE